MSVGSLTGPLSSTIRGKGSISLTKRQREILTYLGTYFRTSTGTARVREIATQLTITPPSPGHEQSHTRAQGIHGAAYNETAHRAHNRQRYFPDLPHPALLGTVAVVCRSNLANAESIGVQRSLVRRSGKSLWCCESAQFDYRRQIRDGRFFVNRRQRRKHFADNVEMSRADRRPLGHGEEFLKSRKGRGRIVCSQPQTMNPSTFHETNFSIQGSRWSAQKVLDLLALTR